MAILQEIIASARNAPGLKRKRQLPELTAALEPVRNFGRTVTPMNDDAAAFALGGEYILLAIDGIMPELTALAPYQAGRAAIIVNANDIYAMGGYPLGMVNLLSLKKNDDFRPIVEGMKEECARLKIPMAGGHFHPEALEAGLAVAVWGRARRLLLSSAAGVGEAVIAAIDLHGRAWGPGVKNWDSHAGKSSDDILKDLSILPRLAASGKATAARDISNAGLLGTLALLLQSSGQGAVVNVEKIPRPEEIPPAEWILYFPSFGFLLTAPVAEAERIIKRFLRRGIAAAKIGLTTASCQLILEHSQEGRALLWDLDRETL